MKTPWTEMLRLAARQGVPPAAFWSLSLREWRMLMTPEQQGEAISRRTFEQLVEAWPDD